MDWISSFSTLVTQTVNEVTTATTKLMLDIGIWEEVPIQNSTKQLSAKQLFGEFEENWKEKIFDLWKKSPDNMSIQTDIPRFCSSLTLLDETGTPIRPTNPSPNPLEIVASIASALRTHLNDPFADLLITDLSNCVVKEAREDLRAILEAHLQRKDAEKSPLVSVLRGVNQQIIFPAYYAVKSILNTTEMKDKPKTWRIAIQLRPNGEIQIRHTKEQLIHSGDIQDIIGEFEWELEINLGFNGSLEEELKAKQREPQQFVNEETLEKGSSETQIKEGSEEFSQIEKEKSINNEGLNEKPSKTEDLNEGHSKTEGLNENTPEIEDPSEKPPKIEGPNEKPSKTEGLSEIPPEIEDSNEKPPKIEDPNEKPSEIEELNEKPSKTEELNGEPSKTEHLNGEPSKTGDLNGEPTKTEEPTPKPDLQKLEPIPKPDSQKPELAPKPDSQKPETQDPEPQNPLKSELHPNHETPHFGSQETQINSESHSISVHIDENKESKDSPRILVIIGMEIHLKGGKVNNQKISPQKIALYQSLNINCV